MFFLKFPVFAALFVLLAAGCSSSRPGIVYAPAQVDQEVLEERAAQLIQVIAPAEIRGIVVRINELQECHFTQPDLFPEHLKKLGFNRIYLYLEEPSLLNVDGLSNVLEATARAGMPVDVILPESSYFLRRSGGWLQRKLLPTGMTLAQVREKLIALQTKTFRFAGVTVIAQPHLYTKENIFRPEGLLYTWDENTFGEGMDNDMLMKISLEKLTDFADKIENVPLSIGIPDFYEELVMDGQISCGSVTDFGKIAQKVIVFNSANKPSELLPAVQNELNNAAPGSVLVMVPLAGHTSVRTGSLRLRNWDDYTRSLNYAITEWKKSPAFGGIVLGPLSQIETLRQEK